MRMSAVETTRDLQSIRDLGVAWMNRGHSQLLLNNPTGDVAALAAYAEAIALLRTLPLAQNPSWANSFGAACMNHGQLLHRIHGTTRAADALGSFDAAIAALQPLVGPDANPWPRRNLAGSLLNRANLLLDLAQSAEAAAAAREAIALCAAASETELIDADLVLKARRALADALGQLIVAPGGDQGTIAAEASDVVDEALALVRRWAARGQSPFTELARRFFLYGTRLYRFHQPHFLGEFIEENLGLGGELRPVALAALDAALASPLAAPTYLTVGDPATERHLQTRRDLETLRARLAPVQ